MMKRMIHRATRHLTLKIALGSFLGLSVLGLVWYNLKDVILGTPLSVATATDGATLDTPFLPISGTARHARELSINGRAVTVNRQGHFTDEVVLSPGYNIVEVAAKDQFGNTKTKTYQVVVQPGTNVASVTTIPTNL
jgi:hypothetical protein